MPPYHFPLNIVVALPCEAKPLVAFYSLRKHYQTHFFSVFENEKMGVRVCVSGIGKIASAAAVAFLAQAFPATNFLNLGVAGSGIHSVGELLIANKLTEFSTGKNFYPSFSNVRKTNSTQIITHDKPCEQYPAVGLVEMEAVGFFKSATLFMDQERVQVVKVVSDTSDQERISLTPTRVEALFQGAEKPIRQIIDTLRKELPTQTGQTPLLNEFIKKWHFSEYQRHELVRLLNRWRVLKPEENPFEFCRELGTSKEVGLVLAKVLNEMKYIW